jgi:hypothetical protein
MAFSPLRSPLLLRPLLREAAGTPEAVKKGEALIQLNRESAGSLYCPVYIGLFISVNSDSG